VNHVQNLKGLFLIQFGPNSVLVDALLSFQMDNTVLVHPVFIFASHFVNLSPQL
jgi:hypothetical protein